MGRRAGLAIVAAAVAVSARAHAVERENQLGLELGVPMLVVQGKSTNTLSGGSFGLHYTYGITDAVNLVADGGTSLMPWGASSLSTTSNLDVGVAYVLDVLRWVPWGAVEAGGYALTGDPVGGTQNPPRLRPGRRPRLPLRPQLGGGPRAAPAHALHRRLHVPELHAGPAARRVHVGVVT